MQNDEVKKLIDSVGALAEMLWVFYSELMNNGFETGEALAMCAEMIRCCTVKNYGRPTDAER